MKLLIVIIKNSLDSDSIVKEYAKNKIYGSTIINASGMANSLLKSELTTDDIPVVGALRKLLNQNREENQLILTVLNDSQVELAVQLVESVVGDLNNENTGICFTLPLDFVKGVHHE